MPTTTMNAATGADVNKWPLTSDSQTPVGLAWQIWSGDTLGWDPADGRDGTYARRRARRVLRGFPVAEVERILRESDRSRQTEAVRDFRRWLGD